MLSIFAAAATVSPWGVVAAAGLISITLFVSWRLDLGLIRSISISSIRSVVQLLAAGVLLVPALKSGAHLAWSWIWCGAMVVFATGLVRRRTADLGPTRPSIFLSALAVSTPLTTGLVIVFCFGVLPLKPSTLVPIAGIVLGNTLPATSVGATRFVELVREERGQIEAMLALGFRPRTAIRPQITKAVKLALTPPIERMRMIGLVLLPGTMTGMLLAGVEPLQAVMTQMVVSFLILGGVTLTVTTVVLGCALSTLRKGRVA
ncbi:MAG TPA: hypothetical protein DCL16_09070 [Acidimicrobiaceae bacterium]|nr:hypothetical protein [Acidimicrobiaceae bacterium]